VSRQEFVSQTNTAVTASSAVEEACDWVRWLVQRESRGNGDRKNAMERLARRYPGMSKTLIRNLMYRAPRDMLLSSYLAIRAAYVSECERHERALRFQREKVTANTLFGEALLGVADCLVRSDDEGLNE